MKWHRGSNALVPSSMEQGGLGAKGYSFDPLKGWVEPNININCLDSAIGVIHDALKRRFPLYSINPSRTELRRLRMNRGFPSLNI